MEPRVPFTAVPIGCLPFLSNSDGFYLMLTYTLIPVIFCKVP